MHHRFAFLLVLASLLFVSCSTPAAKPVTGPLILISIDGFRWDYIHQYHAPTLSRLAAAGVHATRMTPSFPSKTFPNHYTLVTGLRPAHHGIVGNWFYDPGLAETFGMSKPDSNTQERWWDEGEPVWITAEKQGVRSFCYFWPGSEAKNHGIRPSRFKPFDFKLPMSDRVDELLSWLDVPEAQRPGLCTLYFDVVDTKGHKFGPDAPETGAAVAEADAAVQRLLDGLGRLGLADRVNLVLVSDHGMSPCGPDKVIFLEDLIDVSQVQVDSTGPVGGVRPKPGTISAVELADRIRARPRRNCTSTCATRRRRAFTTATTRAFPTWCSSATTTGISRARSAGRSARRPTTAARTGGIRPHPTWVRSSSPAARPSVTTSKFPTSTTSTSTTCSARRSA
ncbi:MAG: ectonucleotide pyrophosphatase/phosphodiesterase [Lacunisphaera sp.]